MSKPLDEQRVLKKLGIPDFRHLSKDKVIAFASMLPNMDPEVAKKALEQFPNFADTSLGIMKEYKQIFTESIENVTAGTIEIFATYDRIIDSLEKMLDQENLSFEEQLLIIKEMREIADSKAIKDSEHKQFIMRAFVTAGTFAAGIVVVLASNLGTNVVSKVGDVIGDKILNK